MTTTPMHDAQTETLLSETYKGRLIEVLVTPVGEDLFESSVVVDGVEHTTGVKSPVKPPAHSFDAALRAARHEIDKMPPKA
ncbi:hypothetical protein WKW79_23700 [Variovorax robiniae]|uniref:Uncharacterized protein n=1 Tax=Variovorax robiniae TaxID=1836199 RepID=A0ABU8XCN1_9BURK